MSSGETYYVPAQSRWPILASVALYFMAFGAASLINAISEESGGGMGLMLLLAGALLLGVTLFGWFGQVISEDRSGLYNEVIDRSFRWGMGWFIFTEVMFFAAFFGALFYVRQFVVPWLGGEGDKAITNMLWQGFSPQWPLMITPDMSAFPGPKQVIDPWQLPLINTFLLLSSSFTVTLALSALKSNLRNRVVGWLLVTITLGVVFLAIQSMEYSHAYREMGLTLHAGIYGATFFILTGFHGMHVTLGALMLIIICLRVLKGHFDPVNHFGFEAVTWYWHFVDVVWVGLFLFVYVF